MSLPHQIYLLHDWDPATLMLNDGDPVPSMPDHTGLLPLGRQGDGTATYDDGAAWQHAKPSVLLENERFLTARSATLSRTSLTWALVARAEVLPGQWIGNWRCTSPATLGLRSDNGEKGVLNAIWRRADLTTVEVLPTNVWHPEDVRLFVMSLDALSGQASLWVDDELVGIVSLQGQELDTAVDTLMALGGHSTADYVNADRMRVFRNVVYDRSLSSVEMQQLVDWRMQTYPPRYHRGDQVLLGANKASVGLMPIANIQHALVSNESNGFDYYTVPEDEMHNPAAWTLVQASALVVGHDTRSAWPFIDGNGVYNAVVDERDGGHQDLYQGTSFTTLQFVQRLFTGTPGHYIRHMKGVLPADSHDGMMYAYGDIRTDSPTGRHGPIEAYRGPDIFNLSFMGVALQPSGRPAAWDSSHVGGPSVAYFPAKGLYLMGYDGHRHDEGLDDSSTPQDDFATHALGVAESADGLTFTPWVENPVLGTGQSAPYTQSASVHAATLVKRTDGMYPPPFLYGGMEPLLPRVNGMHYALPDGTPPPAVIPPISVQVEGVEVATLAGTAGETYAVVSDGVEILSDQFAEGVNHSVNVVKG